MQPIEFLDLRKTFSGELFLISLLILIDANLFLYLFKTFDNLQFCDIQGHKKEYN